MALSKRLEYVVPEEAAGRGPIMLGDLRIKDREIRSILAQFSKIVPHTRRARLYLFPSVEQAQKLFGVNGPFSFEATFESNEGVIETHKATDIWPRPGSQINSYGAVYWTQSSGRVGNLEITTHYKKGTELARRMTDHPAWFVVRRCFALQIIANADNEEVEAAAKFGIARPDTNLSLSGGMQLSVQRYMKSHRFGVSGEAKRNGYSVFVRGVTDIEIAKRDVDAFLVLASLASRERTVNAHWSSSTETSLTRTWCFNFRKFPRRDNRNDPLIHRDRDDCRVFLQQAFDVYSASEHQTLLNSAIYSLMGEGQTLEVTIAHLFSGIQGALAFATKSGAKRVKIGELYRRFTKMHPNAFDGLWPLLDPREGPPLSFFRHAIVHGEAFTTDHFLALSYAGEHIRWHLERIILLALGWDIQKSYVSDRVLMRYYGYVDWKAERSKLAAWVSKP